MPELRGYPKREKRKRAAKRKLVGYDSAEPEMCQNCTHYIKRLYSKTASATFQPRCGKHEFGVEPQATCNNYHAK